MSVLVNGMSMPESCHGCPFQEWDGEDTICYFTGISALNIGRQGACPLVEVPTPYGEWTAEGNDEKGNYWDECTVCREAVWFPPFVKNDYKYCPHCGAKMDA